MGGQNKRNFTKWVENTAEISKKGGQYGGTLLNSWTIRRRKFIKCADDTAEISKKGGQYGRTLLSG